MPEDCVTADPPLLECEWVLLAYICKQIRFGERMEPFSVDELMNGRWFTDQDGDPYRADRGSRLSRNAVVKAMDKLEKRGWIVVLNVSSDKSRPKYEITLNIRKKGEKLVITTGRDSSQRDVTAGSDSSQRDDGSDHDVTPPVTKRRALKEEENPKREWEQEKAGKSPALSDAERETWDLRRWREAMAETEGIHNGGSVGTTRFRSDTPYFDESEEAFRARRVEEERTDAEQVSRDWRHRARAAALKAGVTPERIIPILKKFYPDDPDIDRIFEQTKLPLEEPA